MDCVKCMNLEQVFESRLSKYCEDRFSSFYRVSTELAAKNQVDMERARNDLEEHQSTCDWLRHQGISEMFRDKMTKKQFIVKVNRSGACSSEYVRRIDRTPIQTTSDPKLALVMGRFTAEDAIKSIRDSRCNPQLVWLNVST